MRAIGVRGLRKRYGSHDVVRGVDLDVEVGEIVAILGPNGAGKTTTVEILEGLTARDGGDVNVLGHDPACPGPGFRERVGVVLQQSATEPFVSARELVALHRSFYRRPLGVEEVLGLVGLDDVADQRVRKLSGGQQRRLDVALALVGDPDLVFLDEPTTGFDPEARLRAWAVVRSLQALGKTIVLTTHYLDEAEALADRVVVLRDGVVVADGAPALLAGRHGASSRISFKPIAGVEPAVLPLPVNVSENRWEIEAPELTEALHILTGWALEADVQLSGMSITAPRLEDVYLEVTR